MKNIWPPSDILGPVLPASIVGKQMAIMSRRKQDAGAAQPTLFIHQGHKMPSWALHSMHSARAPSPHFLHIYTVPWPQLPSRWDRSSHTALQPPSLVLDERAVTVTQKCTLQEMAELGLSCLNKGTVLNPTHQVLGSSHRTSSWGFSEPHPASAWKDWLLQHQVHFITY